jgi:hypothetical protein
MRFYTLPTLQLCLRRVFTGYVMTHREHDCRTTVRQECFAGQALSLHVRAQIEERQSRLCNSHGPKLTGGTVTPAG